MFLITMSACCGRNSPSSGCDDEYIPTLLNSSSNIHGDSCHCRGSDTVEKYAVSITNNFEEHIKYSVGDSERCDFDTQVSSTDIKSATYVQTSSSLIFRTPDLPKRCPDRMRIKAANKCVECYDCQETSPVVRTGLSVNFGTQIEPWRMLTHECSQTGPSLTAVGAFCRWDYKLKKTKPDKNDLFFDCSLRDKQPDVVCSRDRDSCFNFSQQVCALDINISETVQTNASEDIQNFYLQIIYGSSQSHVPYKDVVLLDCACPTIGNKRQEVANCFAMQVTQNYISPNKTTQTDLCLLLPHICKKSRKFHNKKWKVECGIHCEIQSENTSTALLDFSEQVTALDIGDTNETQTCWSLEVKKPFRTSPTQCPPCPFTANCVVAGRTSKFQGDTCHFYNHHQQEQEQIKTLNACEQVCPNDICASKEVQTYDQTPNKYYIRNGPWVSKSWS